MMQFLFTAFYIGVYIFGGVVLGRALKLKGCVEILFSEMSHCVIHQTQMVVRIADHSFHPTTALQLFIN